MGLSLVTPPALEPVTLAEAKRHLSVEHTDDDALIETLIRAARGYAETFTGRALITQTWDLHLDRFPCAVIELPKAPVTSVTSITYVDLHGLTQTWDSSQYLTDLPSGPKAQRGRITPASGYQFPATADVINAVTVRFVAGYGSVAALVPAEILLGILHLTKHWYVHRSVVNDEQSVIFREPFPFRGPMDPFRTY